MGWQRVIVSKAPALAALLCVLVAPKFAHALGVLDVEVGLKGGVSTTPNDFKPDIPNPKGGPLGVGLGARGGISFRRFHGGVNALFYFGTDQDSAGTTLSAHSFVYGVEGGYDVVSFQHFALRPQLGIGMQITSGSSTLPGVYDVHDSQSFLYLEPGLTALFYLGMYYVGADANVYLLPNVTRSMPESGTTSSFATAFTLHGQFGVRF
jgi:hypothetical protein